MKIQLSFNTTGQPVVPEGWVAGGGLGTTDTRNAADPQSGGYIKLSEVDAQGNVEVHEPPTGWRDTGFGKVLTFVAGSAWTPYTLADLTGLYRIVNGLPVPVVMPVAVASPVTPGVGGVVKGRTMDQARAMGDVWGFTHDPATDPR